MLSKLIGVIGVIGRGVMGADGSIFGCFSPIIMMLNIIGIIWKPHVIAGVKIMLAKQIDIYGNLWFFLTIVE